MTDNGPTFKNYDWTKEEEENVEGFYRDRVNAVS